ncbi:MAG TPA: serine/threonine-protein kinase [Streptosporangiaceae bacterium]|nr:serine/threonine-protein kinase [Streptosporangiaceae bacterium]
MTDVPAGNSGGKASSLRLPAGSRIAGYVIERELGAGGMATVYLAADERLNRRVALKVLSAELAEDNAFRLRFIRESRVAASVDDPHIIPVFEAGESAGVLFIAMRYVPGGDVHTHIRESGPLPKSKAALILSQVASALDAAHRHDLVHRDVKPANMLMDVSTGGDRPDHVYLSDFGISKDVMSGSALTSTGLFVGTLDYMAPEQIEGQPVNGRADQYSLACSAFELLSGTPPYVREQAMAMIWAHVKDEPPALTSRRPDLPPQVDDVLARALAKSPADRYGTCREFAGALREALRLPQYESGESAIPGHAPRTPTEAVPPAPAAAAPAAAPAPTPMPLAPAYAPTPTPVQPPPGYGPYPQYYLPATGPVPTGPGQVDRRGRQRSLLIVLGACLVAAAIVAGSLLLRSALTSGQNTSGSRLNPAGNSASHPGSRATTPPATRAPSSFTHLAKLVPAGASTGVSTLAFSGAGTGADSLATAGPNGTVYLWNPATGKETGTVSLPDLNPVNALAFSPDGHTLAIADSAGSVYLWNVAGQSQPVELSPVSGSKIESVAFNAAGTTVAAGDASGDIRLWNVAAKNMTSEFSDPGSSGVNALAFSPDGSQLVSGDYNGDADIFQVATSTEVRTLTVPGGAVLAVGFSPDGQTLATGSYNGSTYLWNVADGNQDGAPLTDPNPGPAVESLAFSPDGSLLATGDVSGYTYLWRLSDRQVTQELPSPKTVWAVAFSHDGRYLAVGDHYGATYLWHAG